MRGDIRAVATLLAACALACGGEDVDGWDDEGWSQVEQEVVQTGVTYNLVGVQSGKCVEIAGGSTANGARAQIATCNNSPRQQFRFESMGSGYHRIRNVGSNRCLDIDGRSTQQGAPVIQWDCHSNPNQQFMANDRGNTVHELVARHSGQALDVNARGTADGTPLIQWPLTGGTNQQFRLTPSGGGGGGGTGGASGTGGSSGGGTAGSGGSSGGCNDTCSFASGVTWQCKRRFMYGINYAWHYFGGDFGGISAWGQRGVAQNASAVSQELADMKANGVNVIRWWVWPDFRGNGVVFDGSDTPTGLGATTIADLNRALELAQQHDVYLMLTLFSFDNFRPTRTESGARIPGLRPIVVDSTRRARLMENVVRPFARAAAASPHRHRVIAWDVINEPEWAISGSSLYGDDPFTPDSGLQTVTHTQMQTFIRDVNSVLKSESSALTTVGGAAMKWRRAWSGVNIDFHQFHIYDWVNRYWPYSNSPAQFGVNDKPVVMGEFYTSGLSGANYSTIVNSWYTNGYAGALSWQYRDYRGRLGDVKAFADRNPCTTRY